MRLLKKLVAAGLALSFAGVAANAQPITDAQGDVGIGTFTPHASAKLDLVSTTKGFLVPRMTTVQRNAIAGPADALLIFNLTTRQFEYYDALGLTWTPIGSSGGAFWSLTGNGGTTAWNGAVGNFLGTTDAQNLVIATIMNQEIQLWTNNTQRAVIANSGNVGINEAAPSARLDIVEAGAQSGIEVTHNGTGTGVLVQQTAGTGAGPAIQGEISSTDGGANAVVGVVTPIAPGGFSAGVRGINNGTGGLGIGVYGSQAGSGWGVFGTTPSGIGVNGSSASGIGVSGVSSSGTGVTGGSSTGSAAIFTTSGGAATTVIIDDASSDDALEVNATGTGFGIDLNGGALDGDAAGNALGATTAAQQLTVRGVADAVIGNTLGGNPTVWDLVVTGDMVATGLVKVGGSMWLDGTSATHQLNTNAPLLLATSAGNVEIDAAGGTTTVDDNLIVTGTSDLNGNIFNSLGAVTVNDLLTQTGGGQVTFSGNVDANNGLDVSGANLTVASPVSIQAPGSGHSMGTLGTNATMLTINGVAGSAPYELQVNGDAQITGLLALPTFTAGSVVFAGAGGVLTQDNPNFFWDDATDRLGLGTNATSARLDVVETGAVPAVEATTTGTASVGTFTLNNAGSAANAVAVNSNGTGNGILSRKGAGSALVPGTSGAVWGDAAGAESGVIGTSSAGFGVFGASSTNHAVSGTALGAGVSGVHGRNDNAAGTGVSGLSVGGGTGVSGISSTGIAGSFTTSGGAATTVVVNDGSSGDALEVNATGTGFGIDLNGGALDGDAAGNALGATTAAQQLTVRGVADAVIGNTLGGNPTVWDLVVTGDMVATGLVKVGGSMWLDGTSATHQLNTNAPLLLATSAGNVEIDAAGGTTTVDDNLIVTGTSDLNGNIFNSLGAVTVNDLLTQTGGGQVTFSGNVDANNGLDVTGATTMAGTVNQTGGGQVTFSGNVDANNGLDVTGATTMAGTVNQTGGGQVTFSGNVDANNGLDITGNLTVTGTISDPGSNLAINDNVDITGNIVPTANATYNLGSDANRWAEVYVDGASIHVGPTGGEAGNTELSLGYAANAGAINVNGGNEEIDIDAGASIIRFDPDADGTLNAFVRNDGIGVNTGVGTDILIDQDAIHRNGGATETFDFSNSGGDLDVTVNGNMFVTGNSNVTGMLSGSSAGNSLGDGADATQLTINGMNGGAVEAQVNGDMDITGTLTVGSFAFPPLSSDLDLNGFNIVDNVDNIATVDDNFNVTMNTDLDGTLNVDGSVTLQSTFFVDGNTTLDANTTVNGNAEFNGAAQFDGATTFNANSTWSSGNNITLSNGTLTATKTAAGTAVAINNTNATTAIAMQVTAGGGRIVLSYGTGAGVIPQDVSVWNASGNVTLPGTTENGQMLYIVNTSGAAITVTGVTGGTAAGFNNNDVRGYIYAGGWFEMP